MSKYIEERLKEVLEYRISRAQNEPIDDMDWFIENTIKDVLEAVNPLPSDLEKAAIDKEAKEYAFNNSDDSQEYKSGYLGFIAGAEWYREQMMSEAVEGEVIKDNRGNNVVRAGVFNKDF